MAKSPEERKAGSIEVLKGRGVAWSERQPVIEDEEEAGERTDDELRAQILASTVYWLRAQYANQGVSYREFLKALGPVREMAEGALSESQLAFVEDERPSEEQVVNAAWAVEGLVVLLWAGGLVKELAWPDAICDSAGLEEKVETVLSGAKLTLRPVSDLLDQADLYYRLLWAVVNGKLASKGGEINGSVVYERARALGWLTQPGVEWDDVDMST